MKHLPIEIVYEEYNNGATTIELSEKYNCSVTTIRKRLIEYCEQTGLEYKKRSRGPFKKELPKEKIYNEYREVFRTESAMETTEGIFALFE